MSPSAGEAIVRAAVEFNVVEHCNLSCAACDHASPLLPRKFASLRDFVVDLTALAAVLEVDELRLLGGEPLLHPELIGFVRAARRTGIARRIWLVSNGVLLHRAPEELFDLIDGLWVSRYPGVRLGLSISELEALAAERGFELRLVEVENFRRTLLNTEIRDRPLVRRIYGSCGITHRWSCHTIHEGRYYKCSTAPFLGPRLAHAGTAIDNLADGVALRDNPNLREDLERYLAEDRPLIACGFCLGTSGREAPHRQLDARERSAASTEAHPDPFDYLPAGAFGMRSRVRRALQAARRTLGGRGA